MGNLQQRLKMNKLIKILIAALRKIGLLHFFHILQNKRVLALFGGAGPEFRVLYEEQKNKFDATLSLLDDEKSIVTYKSVIKYRLTRKLNYIYKEVVLPAYFQDDVFLPQEEEVFIDGGAFIGDTIKDFCEIYSSKGIERFKIFAWEIDPQNSERIKYNAGRFSDRVEVLPYALWSVNERISFSQGKGTGSRVSDEGNKTVEARTIDYIHKNDKITYIKMDIEGAEIEALKGAKQTICKYKPKLAICIYHKPEHLYEIPLLLHNWVPEYKFFVRHHSDAIFDTVLYART